jgi:hypothetical protein
MCHTAHGDGRDGTPPNVPIPPKPTATSTLGGVDRSTYPLSTFAAVSAAYRPTASKRGRGGLRLPPDLRRLSS